VKQHKGNISVDSEPGKGTTFQVYLPLLAVGQDQSRPKVLEPPRGGNEMILLAEDDATVRELIKAILLDLGYRVLEAADGQEAIECYQKQHSEIDLLIVDVIMPRKSGRDVYDVVRSASPGAKVLFLSGYTADIIHKKGIFEEGMEFLPKPVSPADLARKIRTMLDRKA
jgi:polar amino acid transport system substrate-binding protein